MTSEIKVPIPCGVRLANKTALRNTIVEETGREAHIRMEERELIVEPESPTHADNILHSLDDCGIQYYHE